LKNGFQQVRELYRGSCAPTALVLQPAVTGSLTRFADRDTPDMLPVDTIYLVGAQALIRLQALHELGIVHRHITPAAFFLSLGSASNLMLGELGYASVPKTNEALDHVQYDKELLRVAKANKCPPYTQFSSTSHMRQKQECPEVSLTAWDDVYSLFRVLSTLAEKTQRHWSSASAHVGSPEHQELAHANRQVKLL